MFCPGMSLDANGRAIITGGDTANKTSIYGNDLLLPVGLRIRKY